MANRTGTGGADTLNGTTADDSLVGLGGDDLIDARSRPMAGSDTLQGGDGNDRLYAEVGTGDANVSDSLDGGAGNDFLSLRIDSEAALNTAAAGSPLVTAVTLDGGAGDDVISIQRGAGVPATGVTIDGGDGTDVVYYQANPTAGSSALAYVGFTDVEELVFNTGGTYSLSAKQVAGVDGGLATADGSALQITLSSAAPATTATYDFSHAFQGLSLQLSLSGAGSSAILTGTAFADKIVLVDGALAATVDGGAGNDVISGGGANTTILGGAGDDTVSFTDAPTTGPSAASIDGGSGANTLNLVTLATGDTLAAGDFAGFVQLDSGATVSRFQTVASLVVVGDGNALSAGDGKITLSATGDGDTLTGGAGKDTLSVNGSNDTVVKGLGATDIALYGDANTAVLTPGGISHLTAATPTPGGVAGLADVDYSTAPSALHMAVEDYATGTGGADGHYIYAFLGPDYADAHSSVQINASAPLDLRVEGSAFADVLVGSADAGAFAGGATLLGGAGDDTIVAGLHGALLDGGDGTDTLSFDLELVSTSAAAGQAFGTGAAAAVTVAGVAVDLGVTTAQATGLGVDTLLNFENVLGSAGADTIAGTEGANALSGGAGNDGLSGGGGDDVLTGGAGDDRLDGGAGDDTVVIGATLAASTVSYSGGAIVVAGPDGTDTLTAVEHVRFSDGLYDVGADGRLVTTPGVVLAGTGGANTLTGGAGDDTLLSAGGADVLHGGPGSDSLDGGYQSDTATYDGFSRSYALALEGGAGTVRGGPEGGTDTLTAIENVSFQDGVLTFDPDSTAAQVVRLYDAFLGRAPDAAGLYAYLDALAGGRTLADIADAAAQSPEFLSHTGALSDRDFVEYVYETALHRPADHGGLDQYVADLQDGTFTRASLILQAAESAEHRELTSATVAAGLWEPNEINAGLALLYDSAVQRLPDGAGLAAYGAELASGTTLRQISNEVSHSAEFQAHFGGLSDADYVNALYEASVGRAADPGGLSAYTAELSHGYTRGDVLYQIATSEEHQGHVLSYVDPLLVGMI